MRAAVKEKNAVLENEEIELNKEPIPEYARTRFMRMLDDTLGKRQIVKPINCQYKGEGTMSKEKESKYNISSTGRTYGYDKKGGWDIDTSDKTQKTSDSGHIPGRYQWEETIDVSAEDEEHEEND